MGKDFIGDTSKLIAAVTEVNKSYQDILHEQVEETVKNQEEVVNRLRKFEKEVGTTTQQINKKIAQTDIQSILEDSIEIDKTLNNIHKKIKECLDMARCIEQEYPSPHKSGLPHNVEFPNLYKYAVQRAKPELIQLSRTKASPKTSIQKE